MTPKFNTKRFALQLGAIGVILLALMAAKGALPSTEVIAGVFVFVFVWTKDGRSFLIEFAPFLLLLVTYKQLRNFADNLSDAEINITNLIVWERALFGGMVPAHYLQAHLWGHLYTPLLDALTNALYLSHFLSPLVISVLLWQKSRSLYWAFAIGIVALSYAAFATYLLFPAAPPWWATKYGYLREQAVTLRHFVVGSKQLIEGANPIAAMPSLHAAYPTYIWLVATHVWGKKGIPVIVLPAGVMFSTFYLGHHYVIDAMAGALYALIAFMVVYPLAIRFAASRDLSVRKTVVRQV
jgi:membrane-associated phospholipid phosphatase